MNNWTREKIRHVALLTIGTAAVLGIIWFIAVEPLRGLIKAKADKIGILQNQIQVTKTQFLLADKYREEIQIGQKELQNLESKMVQGDPYRWIVSYIGDFQRRHDVSIIEPPPPQSSELNVPPKVPYAAVSFAIAGGAYYHDFGAFLADMENSSPFIRLRNLTLQASGPVFAGSTSPEKLTFRAEFVTLIKSRAAQP
jgi:hypothetical protein